VAGQYGRPHSRAHVTFQVRLPPELKEQLERRAFETGQSQVAIVHEALVQYFALLEKAKKEGQGSEPPAPDDPVRTEES
jgi:predicted HicB family RNase H-like nuclease